MDISKDINIQNTKGLKEVCVLRKQIIGTQTFT